MTYLIRAIFARLLKALPFSSEKSASSGNFSAEQLESRILYSAAPVEPAEPAVEEATAPESAPAAIAPAAAEAPAPAVQVPVAVAVAVEPASDGSELATGQEVELVAMDDTTESLNIEAVETLAAEARQRWIDSGFPTSRSRHWKRWITKSPMSAVPTLAWRTNLRSPSMTTPGDGCGQLVHRPDARRGRRV